MTGGFMHTRDDSKYEILLAALREVSAGEYIEIPEEKKKMHFKPKRSMKVKNKRKRKRKR